MLQTSGDILNIVIAVSVALLVLFVCWGLFYLVMAVRNLYKISKEAREGFSKVSEILSRTKEQVESGAFYFSLIGKILKKSAGFLKRKADRGKAKSKKSAKKTPKTKTSATSKAKKSKKTKKS